MAATTVWFGGAFRERENASANSAWAYLADTIKCSLHTATYSPNVDSNIKFSDTSNEVSSANYTAGGFTLTTKTVTYDSATNETRFDADDEVWTTVTFTTRHGIFYKSTGTGTTSPLMWWIDFGGDQAVSAGNFTIVNSATGIAKATA